MLNFDEVAAVNFYTPHKWLSQPLVTVGLAYCLTLTVLACQSRQAVKIISTKCFAECLLYQQQSHRLQLS